MLSDVTVAQLVERSAVAAVVVGPNPIRHPKPLDIARNCGILKVWL